MIELKRKNTRGSTAFRYRLTDESFLMESQVAKLYEIEKSLFLPFSHEATPDGATELHFDVDRMVPFKDWANEPRTCGEVRKLCGEIAWVIDACVENGLPLKNIAFDASLVFYDSRHQAFRFVYLPVEGIEADASKVQAFALDVFGQLLSSEENGAQVSIRIRQLVSVEEARLDPLMVAQIMRSEALGANGEKPVIMQDAPAASMTSSQPRAAEPASAPESKQPRRIVSQPLSARTKRYPWEEDAPAAQSGSDETQSTPAMVISDRPKSERTRVEQPEERLDEKPKRGTISLDVFARQMGSMARGTMVLDLFDEDDFGGPGSGEDLQAAPNSASQSNFERGSGAVAEKHVSKEPFPENEDGESATTLFVPEEQFEYVLVRLKTNERIKIPEGRFVVGKSVHSDYRVAGNTTVSRLHAIFDRNDELCWVEDNKSLNGTFVNNAKLAPTVRMQLSSGDVVRMSDEDFLFEVLQLAEGGR